VPPASHSPATARLSAEERAVLRFLGARLKTGRRAKGKRAPAKRAATRRSGSRPAVDAAAQA
jgi:hypothetical protein